MRSRILSLWLPRLATDRLARAGADPAKPLATYESRDGACRLEAVSAAAEAAGLGSGMTLADARALLPELDARPADPEADRALLERLLEIGERYTPHRAIHALSPPEPGGALWLDVTGCAHLFDGEQSLAADLVVRLTRRGLAARVAIADQPGAAWALARYGEPPLTIVPPAGSEIALAPLPVAALRLPPDVVRMLERLGLARIEQLYPLPRPALAARFGDQLSRRLDQALGRVAEPISPAPPKRMHRAELVFAEPIGHVEALEALTRRLLGELTAGLEATARGARRLTLALYRVDNTVQTVTIGTSRPERDPRRLWRLFEEKLRAVDPGFGIERAILEAELVEPLVPGPIAWRQMGAGDLDQVRDLAPVVDRLAGRLGRPAVVRLRPRPSHLPERAQVAVPALDAWPQPARAGRSRERSSARGGAAVALLEAPAGEARAVDATQPDLCTEGPTRPLRLFARPEPIEAVAPLPDEPPVLFRWRRMVHKVVRVRGPERLAPEWWLEPESDPDAVTRDYFAVEDE
ncbi:MAG: DNA polymerase Y family protein, partial [Geminicoccaceae bacterium]|nr:DNA polymerase Y family protein [Geminicoccaceae bacterium]